MKLGIFGGSFNPVHNGHLNLCRQCADILGLDRVMLMPANLPPHKSVDGLVDFEHRYNMLKLATAGKETFIVSDIEHRLGGTSYTINTIEAVRESYPEAELHLIIGSDMLRTFNRWYRYQDILEQVKLVVGARDQNGDLQQVAKTELDNHPHIIIIPVDVIELSSTEVRERLDAGVDVSAYLPVQVCQYIRENKLYCCDSGGQYGID